MKETIRFDIERIKANKVLLYTLITLFAISILITFGSLLSYKDFLEKKKTFLEYERLKIEQLRNYEQYGAFGFKIIKDISPLCIFFDSGYSMAIDRSNIDTSEIVDVTNSREGQARYQCDAIPISFSTFFMLVTGIISVLIGESIFTGKMFSRLYSKNKFVQINIWSRFLIFELIYLILWAFLFFIIILSNVSFKINELYVLLQFILFMISVRFIIYLSGLVIGKITSGNKSNRYVVTFFWVTSMILITVLLNNIVYFKSSSIESVEKVDVAKLKTLMNMERGIEENLKQTKNLDYNKILDIFKKNLGNYLKEGYVINEKREVALLGLEKKVASFKEMISALFPPAYYQYFSNELSNEGQCSYHIFKETCFNYKYQFTLFYIQKRFYTMGKNIESFIKKDENIIPIKAGIPKLYLPALGISILFCIILYLICLYLLQRRKKVKIDNGLSWTPKPGVIHFKLFGTDIERDNAFRGFELSEECLDKDESEIMEFLKVRMLPFVNYFLCVSGTDRDRFSDLLQLFGVQPENIKLDSKLIKKIYAAIILAQDGNVVMNDFIRNESTEFYEQFEAVLMDVVNTGKSVLYLSSQMYTPKGRKHILKNADIAEIDIKVVSLK